MTRRRPGTSSATSTRSDGLGLLMQHQCGGAATQPPSRAGAAPRRRRPPRTPRHPESRAGRAEQHGHDHAGCVDGHEPQAQGLAVARSGVIWCSRLMTMGCTEPSANPSSTEHKPMARADGSSGYTANSTAVTTMAPATTTHSRSRSATMGSSTRITAAAIANAPRMEPMTDADSPARARAVGTTKVCTSQHDESTQFTSSRRRNAAR
jgi:hypothetical protein